MSCAIDRFGSRTSAGRSPGADGYGVVGSAVQRLEDGLHASGAPRLHMAVKFAYYLEIYKNKVFLHYSGPTSRRHISGN